MTRTIFSVTLVMALCAPPVWAQSPYGPGMESLFINGGYANYEKPSATDGKKNAGESKTTPSTREADGVSAGADAASTQSVTQAGATSGKGFTDKFFEDTSRKSPLTWAQLYEKAGHLADSVDADAGEIIDGEPSAVVSFGTHDTVYINKGEANNVGIGSRFIVLTVEPEEVTHPVSGDSMGHKILVSGVIEVVDVDMDVSKAKVVKSYHPLARGDKILPYNKADIPNLDPDRPVPAKEIEGYLVASNRDATEYATGDIVFLDVGKSAGVEPGDAFNVIDKRPVVRKDGSVVDGLPKIVGKTKVILVEENSSTALISSSRDVIFAGDKIVYSRTR